MLTVLSSEMSTGQGTLHKLSTILLTYVNNPGISRRETQKKIHRQKASTLAAYRLRGLETYVNSKQGRPFINHLFLFYLSKTRTSYQQFVLTRPEKIQNYPQVSAVNFLTLDKGLVYNLK